MAEVGAGGQAKVDALVALSQRTVFAPTWRMGDDGYRTVVSSNGVAALPVWLDFEALADASMAFGWALPDGRVAYKEIGARAALGHALANNLLVVVEMGTEHSMEVEQEEMRLLLAPQARSESSGAFAGAGRLQSSLMRAVRPPTPATGMPRVTPPGGLPSPVAQGIPAPSGYVPAASPARAPEPRDQPARAPERRDPSEPFSPRGTVPQRVSAPFSQVQPSATPFAGTPVSGGGVRNGATPLGGTPVGAAPVQATFGAGVGGVVITPLQSEASDALLRRLADSLRSFPEVEWALLASVARGPAPPVPTVAVRVDAAFRMRVNDIVAAVRAAAAAGGAGLDVLLLDDAQLMRLARAAGQPFYPWRR